jgi:hypothetical protein
MFFGGLVVSMLASGTQDRGFRSRPKPSDFSGETFLSMSSFGREVEPFARVADLRHVKEPYNLP